MFRLLQFMTASVILVLAIVLFKKYMHRSKTYLTGMCIVILLASIFSGIVLKTIPMPTQEVRITALQKKNKASEGKTVALQSVIADGKEYPITEASKGNWIYSAKDDVLVWVDEGDKRWNEEITNEIVLDIPVGGGRTLVFNNGPQYGKVSISYESKSKTYDLYKDEEGIKKIHIADSNPFYDNFIKLVRLVGYGVGIICAIAIAFLLVKSVGKETVIKIMCGGLALISTLTFYINMKQTSRSGTDLIALAVDFNKSFSMGSFILAVILVPMLYKTYLYCAKIYREKFTAVKSTVCIAVPAGFFAIFMVIGLAFATVKNLHYIFEDELYFLRALFVLIGYFPIFFFGITWIFNFLNGVDICKASERKYFKPIQLYFNALRKKPFVIAFVTLIVIYIPYIVASYPVLLMGDSPHQFRLVFGIYDLDNAHPITHTLFVKLCVNIGIGVFGSVNAGVFIYAILQMLFVILAISLLIKLLISINASTKAGVLLILYYAVQPWIQNFMMLITKDVINATFMLIFIMALYMLFTKKSSPVIYAVIAISDLGALLFRHDSSYIIVISLVLMLFFIKKHRKQLVIIASCTLCFAFLWNNVLLKQLDIPNNKPTEISAKTGVLGSIMVQQTARCVRDVGDKITEEEKEAISAFFDYDKIADNYNPILVNGARSTIKIDATDEDWKTYQKTWLTMLFKYPDVYIEAILHNNYEFFYPAPVSHFTYIWSETNMKKLNNIPDMMPTELSYPEQLSDFRTNYEALRDNFFSMPVFNVLYFSYLFIFSTLIWLFYCIYRNNKTAIAITIPFLIMILVLIAGPTNGRYFRYVYPFALCMPAVIMLGLYRKRETDHLESAGNNVEDHQDQTDI